MQATPLAAAAAKKPAPAPGSEGVHPTTHASSMKLDSSHLTLAELPDLPEGFAGLDVPLPAGSGPIELFGYVDGGNPMPTAMPAARLQVPAWRTAAQELVPEPEDLMVSCWLTLQACHACSTKESDEQLLVLLQRAWRAGM